MCFVYFICDQNGETKTKQNKSNTWTNASVSSPSSSSSFLVLALFANNTDYCFICFCCNFGTTSGYFDQIRPIPEQSRYIGPNPKIAAKIQKCWTNTKMVLHMYWTIGVSATYGNLGKMLQTSGMCFTSETRRPQQAQAGPGRAQRASGCSASTRPVWAVLPLPLPLLYLLC